MSGELTIYAVYKNPLDYPNKFVVRRNIISDGGKITFAKEPECVVDNYEEIMPFIPYGLVRIPRDESDVLSIVESWL